MNISSSSSSPQNSSFGIRPSQRKNGVKVFLVSLLKILESHSLRFWCCCDVFFRYWRDFPDMKRFIFIVSFSNVRRDKKVMTAKHEIMNSCVFQTHLFLSSGSQGSAGVHPSSHRLEAGHQEIIIYFILFYCIFIFWCDNQGLVSLSELQVAADQSPGIVKWTRAQVVPLHPQMQCWDICRCEGWGSVNVSALCSHLL